jgi:hypothetical protein
MFIYYHIIQTLDLCICSPLLFSYVSINPKSLYSKI